MATLEIQKLLDKYATLTFDQEKQKVICSLTKHEMPSNVAAIESYLNGKKFKRASTEQSYNYDQYKPHIMPSSKRKHLHELFCTLTLRHISRTPDAVERHVKGKKYQRALARWKKCKETGEKFIPRGGRRKKEISSDTESFSGGENFWSDSNEEDDLNADDDMSDLYPPEDFAGPDVSEDEDEMVSNGDMKPSKIASTANADEGSDYDLGVMDSDEEASVKAPTPTSSLSLQKTKRKKQKLKKRSLDSSGVHQVVKQKKRKIT